MRQPTTLALYVAATGINYSAHSTTPVNLTCPKRFRRRYSRHYSTGTIDRGVTAAVLPARERGMHKPQTLPAVHTPSVTPIYFLRLLRLLPPPLLLITCPATFYTERPKPVATSGLPYYCLPPKAAGSSFNVGKEVLAPVPSNVRYALTRHHMKVGGGTR